MPDPIKALAAKKEKILQDAQNEAAEIERDMHELTRMQALAEKHGFTLVEKTTAAVVGGKVVIKRREPDGESTSRKAKRIAAEFIREKNRPMEFVAIYNHLTSLGMKFGGERGEKTLGAFLSQSDEIESIRRGVWWLKGVKEPKKIDRIRLNTEGGGSLDLSSGPKEGALPLIAN